MGGGDSTGWWQRRCDYHLASHGHGLSIAVAISGGHDTCLRSRGRSCVPREQVVLSPDYLSDTAFRSSESLTTTSPTTSLTGASMSPVDARCRLATTLSGRWNRHWNRMRSCRSPARRHPFELQRKQFQPLVSRAQRPPTKPTQAMHVLCPERNQLSHLNRLRRALQWGLKCTHFAPRQWLQQHSHCLPSYYRRSI